MDMATSSIHEATSSSSSSSLNEATSSVEMDENMGTSSLRAAASSGNTERAMKILFRHPDFAWEKDIQSGWTPLHISCSKGHLEITRELMKLDLDLCSIQDNKGRTPLHCAAIKGRMTIIDEILRVSPSSAHATTFKGETILHLAVRNNQYEVVKYLTESLNTSKLVNMPDSDGNTVLHLAISEKLNAMVTYLLKVGTNVNYMNSKGYTPLDLAEDDATNSGVQSIVPALLEAGAKRRDKLSKRALKTMDSTSKHFSPPGRARHHRAKRLEFHNEGLRNARKTIIIVAVLIATVSFTAGLNPPGGFNQETGKAVRGNRTAFKVFLICNTVALCLSIGIVNVLVSIIPFTRETITRLLTITHKVMWLSTMFMTMSYLAGVWTMMPNNRGARLVSVELVVVGGGCLMVVFLGLGLLLARHWLNKYKWRKAKQRRNQKSRRNIDELRMRRKSEDHKHSSNSNVVSSDRKHSSNSNVVSSDRKHSSNSNVVSSEHSSNSDVVSSDRSRSVPKYSSNSDSNSDVDSNSDEGFHLY